MEKPVISGIFPMYDYNEYCKACRENDLETIKIMEKQHTLDLEGGLYLGCYNGHMDIINFMISRGATNFKNGLDGAKENNHIEIIKLMEKLIGGYEYLRSVCKENKKKIMEKYPMFQGIYMCNENILIKLKAEYRNFNLSREFIKEVIKEFPSDITIEFDTKTEYLRQIQNELSGTLFKSNKYVIGFGYNNKQLIVNLLQHRTFEQTINDLKKLFPEDIDVKFEISGMIHAQ